MSSNHSHAQAGYNRVLLLVAGLGGLLFGGISTRFAGALTDWGGPKKLMILSGLLFVVSVPRIALSNSYGALVFGRLLQGGSGGLIGEGVPLYLAKRLGRG